LRDAGADAVSDAADMRELASRLGPAARGRWSGRRRARFVVAMKLVLPTLAASLAALVLAWPGAFDRLRAPELPGAGTADRPIDAVAVQRPRYIGTDARGRPFMVTAAAGSQAPDDLKSVILNDLQADITMTDGSWFTMLAERGRYHQEAKVLLLAGAVDVYSNSGYEFHATDLSVDLEAGRAVTANPVQGHGPFGELKAKRMEISRQGERLFFDDGVSATVYPGRSE
jgi:lipopolysaccharide export system protein LptC